MKRSHVGAFEIIASAAILAALAAFLLPLVLVFMVSITTEPTIRNNGYQLFPASLSFESYRMMLRDPLVGRSYLISTFVTGVGTVLAVTITTMAAYTLANRQVRYRHGLALFFFVPMVFHSGLVPWYMMCRLLGLKDNLAGLIVPRLLFSGFNMFLVRNYMSGIPDSLMESARIDGASDATIAFRIYVPLSVPVIATVTLFYGIAYWSDWFNAVMLIDVRNKDPLQFLLFKLQSEINMLAEIAQASDAMEPPKESFKMATAIVTVGPIILLYPYLQRYFIKGLVIGSIKG